MTSETKRFGAFMALMLAAGAWVLVYGQDPQLHVLWLLPLFLGGLTLLLVDPWARARTRAFPSLAKRLGLELVDVDSWRHRRARGLWQGRRTAILPQLGYLYLELPRQPGLRLATFARKDEGPGLVPFDSGNADFDRLFPTRMGAPPLLNGLTATLAASPSSAQLRRSWRGKLDFLTSDGISLHCKLHDPELLESARVADLLRDLSALADDLEAAVAAPSGEARPTPGWY